MEHNRFYIETYGCTSNKADSNIILNILSNSNYILSSLEEADFVIINTCAVKEQTENKIKTRLQALYELYRSNPNKKFIIAGCLPHITPDYINVIKSIFPTFSAIIDLDNINDLSKILEEIENGKKNLIYKTNKLIDKSEFLINYPSGKITGIVPISEGCLGSCTYCCVKNARGKLKCYDPKNILRNIEHQLNQGIKQIYLTSQDCSTYENENVKLVDLIKDIIDLDFKFYLRIGMINPSFLIRDLDQLIEIYNNKKVYQFLHVPIQSGSNNVLKAMQRPYLISDIIESIYILREKFPYLTISTDIICGFPGESEFDFHRTINLVKWLKPEILNISKFTPRPGTKAKKMKQIDSKTIKKRSIRLSKVFRNSLITINEKWMNWEGEMLVLHKGNISGQLFGRNIAYKNIFIDNYQGKNGDFINIKIKKIDGFNLYGEIIT